MVGVSWYEAVAYCSWLTAETGDAKRPYRLPTEAEWERAAAARRQATGDSRRYPWGDQWDKQRCNNKELGLGQTTPVGQFSPAGDSPEGVSDLAGNVWEWCSTRYGGVDAKPKFGYPYQADEREDLEGDDTRILRGGSWFDWPGLVSVRLPSLVILAAGSTTTVFVVPEPSPSPCPLFLVHWCSLFFEPCGRRSAVSRC